MKLILLSKRMGAHGFGGVESQAESLSCAAVEQGHQVVVLTTAHPHGVTEETIQGVSMRYLPETPAGVYSSAWWRHSADAVGRLLDQGFGDLMLSMNLAGYGVAGRTGIPHYAWSTGKTLSHLISEWHNWSGFAGLAAYPKHALACCYYAWIEARLWARLDGIIAEDDQLYENLIADGRPALRFYAGVDPRQFRPDPDLRAATRRKLGIPPGAQVLVMAATVNRQKGIGLGVEAFQGLASHRGDLHLLVLGDGPDRPRLEKNLQRSACGKRVIFAGSVPWRETPGYWAAADLLLYPTLRREGIPRAIIEAMAAGLPVIASDRGGIRSAVRHGETGVLLPVPEVGVLMEAIERVLADPDGRASMGRQARARALECFDVRAIVAQLLQTLDPAKGKCHEGH